MKIFVNDIEMDFYQETIGELILFLGLNPERIALACNEEVVPKSFYDEQILSNGDKVEIINFIGGG